MSSTSGILGIVWRNFTRRARTRQPDDMVPRPAVFRALIDHDTSLCTGCGTCNHVCSPQAITIERKGDATTVWKFFAGQCSFCNLCVLFCPTNALTNRGRLPAVTGDQSQLRVAHEVVSPPCAQCGRPAMPLAPSVLPRLYGGAVTADVAGEQQLCTECRRTAACRQFMNAVGRRATAPRERRTNR